MSYFECVECGYIFSNREEVERHWRYDVTGEHSQTDDPEIGEHLKELE